MTRWSDRTDLDRTESGGHTTEARLGIHRGREEFKTMEGAPAEVDDERSVTTLIQKDGNERQRQIYNDTIGQEIRIKIKICEADIGGIINYENGE